MQIKFFALLDVFFSVEASPSTIASRYCETDKLANIAWQLFGSKPLAGDGLRQFAISFATT
jgi:hypothetical protein